MHVSLILKATFFCDFHAFSTDWALFFYVGHVILQGTTFINIITSEIFDFDSILEDHLFTIFFIIKTLLLYI